MSSANPQITDFMDLRILTLLEGRTPREATDAPGSQGIPYLLLRARLGVQEGTWDDIRLRRRLRRLRRAGWVRIGRDARGIRRVVRTTQVRPSHLRLVDTSSV